MTYVRSLDIAFCFIEALSGVSHNLFLLLCVLFTRLVLLSVQEAALETSARGAGVHRAPSARSVLTSCILPVHAAASHR